MRRGHFEHAEALVAAQHKQSRRLVGLGAQILDDRAADNDGIDASRPIVSQTSHTIVERKALRLAECADHAFLRERMQQAIERRAAERYALLNFEHAHHRFVWRETLQNLDGAIDGAHALHVCLALSTRHASLPFCQANRNEFMSTLRTCRPKFDASAPAR